MVCLGNICINTLHKGDNDDNNNNNVTIQNIFHVRNNIMCSTNCKYRTAATVYPRNMVCCRYIIVNTMHQGGGGEDDDDDDNNNNNNDNGM
jgi:hypothetical protein